MAPLKLNRWQEWDACIDVDLKGVLYGLGSVLPVMEAQKSGHNIFVSSVAGHVVNPLGAVYCATKFGVRAIAEALRQEVKAEASLKPPPTSTPRARSPPTVLPAPRCSR